MINWNKRLSYYNICRLFTGLFKKQWMELIRGGTVWDRVTSLWKDTREKFVWIKRFIYFRLHRTISELALWNKIKDFQLDDHQVDFTFSDRLARENGWASGYSLRVIEQYKKFIFLCCTTQTGITPSNPVDQAWHLHLTFTKSYWTDLCKNTLEKEIHHNPTKGGQKEAEKFNDFYTATRKIYLDKLQSSHQLTSGNPIKFGFQM